MAALLAAAVAGYQHAGGIEAILAEQAHLGSAHTGVGMPAPSPPPALRASPVRHGVVIQVAIKGAAEARQPWFTAAPKPALRGFSMTRAPGARPAPHQTFAAVIHDDHFKVAPCLPREGFDTIRKPRIRSQGGDHHRYEEIRQTSILPRLRKRYPGSSGGLPCFVWFAVCL